MKAQVDQEMCIGCGMCAATAADVFEVNDEGKAVVIAETTDANKDAVQEAIDGCPVSAITAGE